MGTYHSYDLLNIYQILPSNHSKGRCNREKPPCKYFHPPKHLKDQLIINGKNHLALKNALLCQQVPFQTVLAGQLPMVSRPSFLISVVQIQSLKKCK